MLTQQDINKMDTDSLKQRLADLRKSRSAYKKPKKTVSKARSKPEELPPGLAGLDEATAKKVMESPEFKALMEALEASTTT